MSGLPDKFVKFPAVKVTWHDAHSLMTSWQEFDEIDQEPCVVETIGYLLHNAKGGHVVVAQSINNAENYDSLICIPEGMVKSIVHMFGRVTPLDPDIV
jgi:hypothetical protein